jgi:hypothetical protein
VTAESAPAKEPERLPPSRPPPPRAEAAPAPATAPTADFLNLAKQPDPKPEKKLKSEDSFDFFGMMEKKVDEFGEFLSGKSTENTQVTVAFRL